MVIGALLLFISLFLNWFEPEFSAWTAFELIDVVLAVGALVTILAVVAEFGRPQLRRWLPALEPKGLFLIALGVTAIVLLQLINHPPAAVNRAPMIGAWLALGGSVAMLVGSILRLAEVSVSVNLGSRDQVLSARRPEEPTERRTEPT